MKKEILFLSALVLLSGLTSCSSSKNKSPGKVDTEVIEPLEAARTAKKDYEVLDFSEASTPQWIKHPKLAETIPDDRDNYRFFVNESSHTDQRLCIKSAEVRATAKIASEIAQFMKNTYAEATQGGANEQVTEYMQEQLAQDAQTFIVGAQVTKTYWEKRKYSVKLGASEDKIKFYCYAAIKMDKKQLDIAIKKSTDKLLIGLKDPEVKQKTDKILKDVSDKFNAVEAP